LETYSINGSSPIAHALFVASRRFGLYSRIEVRKKETCGVKPAGSGSLKDKVN
jgi:hypothetical protein